MRNDAPILHRSHSTPAPTLHKRASSGTGAQIVPLMPSRVKSEKPADEDDILDYSVWLTVWEKEVEALSARVQRLASISRCPELVAVARQHSRKAEQVRVVRTAGTSMSTTGYMLGMSGLDLPKEGDERGESGDTLRYFGVYALGQRPPCDEQAEEVSVGEESVPWWTHRHKSK